MHLCHRLSGKLSPKIRCAHRDKQRGAAAVIIAGFTLVFTGLTLLVLHVGHSYVTHQRLQNAADSLALALAAAVRDLGPAAALRQFPQLTIQIATQYSVPEMELDPPIISPPAADPVHPERRYVTVTGRLTHNAVAGWLDAPGDSVVSSRAYTNQISYGSDWKPVILAIDHGIAMNIPLQSNVPQMDTAWKLTKAMLPRYLRRHYPARHGLIVFDGDFVFGSHSTRVLAPPINNLDPTHQLARILPFFNQISDPGGFFNVKTQSNGYEALREASRLLAREQHDDAIVIVISPGIFNRGDVNELNPMANEVGRLMIRQSNHVRRLKGSVASLQILPDPNTWGTMQWLSYKFGSFIAGMLDQMLPDAMMRGIAGGTQSAGGDFRFHSKYDAYYSVPMLLRAMTRFVCRWEIPPEGRGKGLATVLLGDVGTPDGEELPLQQFDDPFLDIPPQQFAILGNGVSEQEQGEYIMVGDSTCRQLGEDPRQRLIIRYGAATLGG